MEVKFAFSGCIAPYFWHYIVEKLLAYSYSQKTTQQCVVLYGETTDLGICCGEGGMYRYININAIWHIESSLLLRFLVFIWAGQM